MEKMIAYKARIKNRGVIVALRYLAKLEGVKFNTYLEKVFIEHTDVRGITWNEDGDLIIKQLNKSKAQVCKHPEVNDVSNGHVCSDCGQYLIK